jgi:uncharacterized protein (TIGR00369 family)
MSLTDADREAFWRQMEGSYLESNIHRVLGLSLQVVGKGEVIVAYDGRADAGNRRGIAAGGALTEMIDSAVVQASRTLLEPEDGLATLELKVNFIRPGEPGKALSTRARIEHSGRTTAVGVGRVEDGAGRLVAIGVVTVSVTRVAAAAAPRARS